MRKKLVSLMMTVALLGSLSGIGVPVLAASATGCSEADGGYATAIWPDPIESAETTPTNTTSVTSLNVGSNESAAGELVAAWSYPFNDCNNTPSPFGSSPAIGDLGLTPDLQIVTGSDEMGVQNPLTGEWMPGAWRAFDAVGNMLWIKSTESDQARGSPVIVDLNGDGNLEIASGTTSGRTVEVLDRFGRFVWTFPHPPGNGNLNWYSSPAAADVMPGVSGLEIFIGNRPLGELFALKGDPDGIDDGISAADIDWPPGVTGENITGWEGVEGEDWDLLWVFETDGSIMSTPAIGDVTGAGNYVVVFGAGAEDGSPDGKVYMLEAATGKLLWSFQTGGNFVQSSPALADFDGDGKVDMVVIGSSGGSVYFIEIPELLQSQATFGEGGASPTVVSTFYTGAPVHSSPAIGDVNGDGYLEVIIGSTNGNVYSLSYDLTTGGVSQNWIFHTGGQVVSSPALADRGHGRLDVYIGSLDHKLYLLNGVTGEEIAHFDSAQSVKTSPAVADVDGDGHLDVFFTAGGDIISGESPTASNTSTFWSLKDTGSEVSPYALEWPMFRHDPERTGVYKEIAPVEHTLIVGSTAGGSVTTPGEGSFTCNHRAVISLVATPTSGYRFSHWTGDVGSVADVNAASTTICIRGNCSITGNFVRVYDLTISSTTWGSVSGPGEGTFTYNEGTVVSLEAEPEEGCRFVMWIGDVDDVADVTAASTNITMNHDYSVTATFKFGTGCFIATAAYGTPLAEEMQILREFRDEYLLTNLVGKAVVDFYYRVSPPIAEFITKYPILKPIVRAALVPAVAVSTIAVNTTPTEKTVIVGLLVLVPVVMVIWAKKRRGRGPGYA